MEQFNRRKSDFVILQPCLDVLPSNAVDTLGSGSWIGKSIEDGRRKAEVVGSALQARVYNSSRNDESVVGDLDLLVTDGVPT